ncbi:hypothetical protein [Streptomyces sp. NPDC058751]|uniref:hypothetical protein n=1 Tax=Streptomyces sp. NPDC058751 TaxID=3346623 RepID=UPI0036C67D2F
MTDEAQQHAGGPLLNLGCLMLLVVLGGLATMLYGLGVLVFGDTPASSAATVLLAGLALTVLGSPADSGTSSTASVKWPVPPAVRDIAAAAPAVRRPCQSGFGRGEPP